MSLARIGIKGAYFTAAALLARQAVSIITTIYVARHLSPADTGLFAMVMIVIGLAQVFGDIGLGAGIVRTQADSEKVLSTCYWLSMAIGVMLAAIVFVSAPHVAKYFDQHVLIPFIQVSSVGLLVSVLLSTPLALLQMRLDYRSISIAQVVGSFSGACATLFVLLQGGGIWALVTQPIVGNFMQVATLHCLARWVPKLTFSLLAVRDILSSSLHILGSGLISYGKINTESLAIGRFLGPKDLGLYSMAGTILYAPQHLITGTASRVLFPLFSKIKDDPKRLESSVLVASHRIALVVLPIYTGIWALADDLVLLLLGGHWAPLATLVEILAAPSALLAISMAVGPVMLALNKAKESFYLATGAALLHLVVVLMVAPMGTERLAFAVAVTSSLAAAASVYFVLYLSKIEFRKYARAMAAPVGMSVCMGLLIVFGEVLVHDALPITRFMLLAVGGAVFYLTAAWFFEKDALQQILRLKK